MIRRALMMLAVVSLVAGLSVTLAGCEKEGAAERAGKKMDSLIDKAGDKLDKLKD